MTMGKALYRKYRSRGLSEIVGQDHITTTLRNALKSGKIAHAYLLTGPRGVGKTSIARILAHEVNGLEYSEEPHFDIIEIDAASNNGVEDVRDLRDKILSAPTSAKYKVFIIDEVHMLSKAAFNALLKTLEEPPAHVIFILATTEAHKLPETIISRTQRYSFRPVSKQAVVEHLKQIAKKENITVDDAALELIAEHGEGSFRDSISLLDQASSVDGDVTSDAVERLLGRAPTEYLEQLITAISEHDGSTCMHVLGELHEHGYEAAVIAAQLGRVLRTSLLSTKNSAILPRHETIQLLRALLEVPAAHNSQALLEITLLQASMPLGDIAQQHVEILKPSLAQTQPARLSTEVPTDTEPQKNDDSTRVNLADKQKATNTDKSISDDIQSTSIQNTRTESAPPAETPAATSITGDDDVGELWHQALQQLKQTYNTLYGIARMARPSISDDILTLELTFAFHQKRLNEPKNRSILTKIIEDIRKQPTQIRCITTAAPKPTQSATDHVTTISNIFGGAELLES